MKHTPKTVTPPGAARVELWRIALVFLAVGLGSFSLAALGEAREWMTTKNRWFTEDEYMRGVGLAQLLPGAPSVNLSSYLGFRLRGLCGAATATISFLIPCFFLMVLLSDLYFRYGEMRIIAGLFRGLGALVIGLILNTIVNLWKSGVKTPFHCLMALAGFVMVFWFKTGMMWIFLLAGSASCAIVLLNRKFPSLAPLTGNWRGPPASHEAKFASTPSRKTGERAGGGKPFPPGSADSPCACFRAPLSADWRKMTSLILRLIMILSLDLVVICLRPEFMRMGGGFLRIGALTFGSGYAMLPFIQNVVVTRFGWLTNQQFAAALALSLITPGPVTIIGAFIGYRVGGFAGAAVGMVNMYFPAWAMTTIVAAPYAKASRAVLAKNVIGGIVAAFIGTLVVVLLRLSVNTLVDFPTVAMAAGAFAIQRFVRLDTVWIVLGGALISLAIFS